MGNDVAHSFGPVSDGKSRILIVGTMPSVQSRSAGFYYAHPRNRFWLVLAGSYSLQIPESVEDKTRLLIENGIALWDVLASCEISGSGDSSIRNPVCNDISALVSENPIEKVLCNGKKAYDLYRHFFNIPLPTLYEPSTSPANAAWSAERLIAVWKSELCPEICQAEAL